MCTPSPLSVFYPNCLLLPAKPSCLLAYASFSLHGINARVIRILCNRQKFEFRTGKKDRTMDRGMGSSLPIEKLDRNKLLA